MNHCSICISGYRDSYKSSNSSKDSTSECTCTICGKVLSSGFGLKRHMLVHSKEKPFSCEYCSKSFSTSGNLKAHVRIHSGEKPYVCVKCGQTFTHRPSLIFHLQRHHSPSQNWHTEELILPWVAVKLQKKHWLTLYITDPLSSLTYIYNLKSYFYLEKLLK